MGWTPNEPQVDVATAQALANRIEAELKVEFDRPGLHVAYGTDPISNSLYFRIRDVERRDCPEQAIADAASTKLAELTSFHTVVHCISAAAL